MQVVVCGGGVIGASIAHFLAERGAKVVVVERTGVACAASGKSGGFLAYDWCDGSPLQALARRSFALHGELAARLGGDDWGYRRLDTFAGGVPAHTGPRRGGRVQGADWLSESVALHRRLGSTESTAQVDPGAFTRAMLRAAEAKGARLHRGEVSGLRLERRHDGARVTGVEVDGEALACDA
ncbi:MAG TPA: FAD-dependent oxidoreductase, partial [Vineibacter sp.]|nr:FAD-dependent oxidoreductase [Vineibacter sp.]